MGSFVNMLVYRTAGKYKITNHKLQITNNKRSYCDYCGRQLRWYENIPVVSWVIQRGKSRCCKKSLDVSYPVVELTTGWLFVAWWMLNQTVNFEVILGMVVMTVLVFEAVFDLKYMILPDFGIIILVMVAVILGSQWWAGVAGGMFLLVLHLATRGKGMGMGDVKLALFMGLFLGWQRLVAAFYLAFILGAMVGVGLILTGKMKKNSQIPFGPFLITGTLICWWFGDRIIKAVTDFL